MKFTQYIVGALLILFLSAYSSEVIGIGIGSVAEGHVSKRGIADPTPLPVYIFCDYTRYKNGIDHDSYLAVVTDTKILFKDLNETDYNSSFDDNLYVCDVDGDEMDEIIVQQAVGASGGAGSYSSRIFKVIDDKIVEIFNSIIIDPSDAGWHVFDTGFTSEFLNDYKLKITNTITGYSTKIDISNKYIDEYFDENGKGKAKTDIWCDSFLEFTPEDVDSDGIFEIVCLQYTSLDGHSDYLGDARSILKFNSVTQKFEVFYSEFIPADCFRRLRAGEGTALTSSCGRGSSRQ